MFAASLALSTIHVDSDTIFVLSLYMMFGVLVLLVLAAGFAFASPAGCKASEDKSRTICGWGVILCLLSAVALAIAFAFLSSAGQGFMPLGKAIFLALASAAFVYASPFVFLWAEKHKND